jgi:hypothetical protein
MRAAAAARVLALACAVACLARQLPGATGAVIQTDYYDDPLCTGPAKQDQGYPIQTNVMQYITYEESVWEQSFCSADAMHTVVYDDAAGTIMRFVRRQPIGVCDGYRHVRCIGPTAASAFVRSAALQLQPRAGSLRA